MQENIVVRVGADISVYERQMMRLAEETDRGLGRAARSMDLGSARMLRSQEGLSRQLQSLTAATYDFKEQQLQEWAQDTARTTDEVAALQAEATRRHLAQEEEKARQTRTFLDGLREGYEDLLRRQMTWADQGRKVFGSFVHHTTNLFSDSLFTVLKGDFEDLGQAWQAFVDSMLRAFTDVLARMAAEWAAAGVASWFSGGFGGGVGAGALGGLLGGGGTGQLVGAATGAVESVAGGVVETVGGLLGLDQGTPYVPQTMPAVVHQGERVLSKMDNQRLVAALEKLAAGPQAVQVHVHGDTLLDAQTLNQVAAKVGEALSRRQKRLVYATA